MGHTGIILGGAQNLLFAWELSASDGLVDAGFANFFDVDFYGIALIIGSVAKRNYIVCMGVELQFVYGMESIRCVVGQVVVNAICIEANELRRFLENVVAAHKQFASGFVDQNIG